MFLSKRLLISSILIFLFSGIVFVTKPAAQEKSEVVARINGTDITLEEMESFGAFDIFEAKKNLYQARVKTLKRLLISKLIKLDKRSKGLDQQQFIIKYIVKAASEISKEEIQAFADQQKIPAEKLTQSVKDEIVRYINDTRINQQVEQWFFSHIKENKIETLLNIPQSPVFDIAISNAPYLGGKSAKITIVEFSDFECPFCAQSSQLGHDLVKKHGNSIKFVYKQFPLSTHQYAKKAAEASLCAKDQGQDYFWKMHDKMFADQKKLTVDDLIKSAESIKLNTKKFSKCLNSSVMTGLVEQDINQGIGIGVRSTPTFYINGRKYDGERTEEKMSEYIKAL